MSTPTPVLRPEFPAPTGAFDDDTAIALVADFCAAHHVHRRTGYTVVPDLDRALRIASVLGADPRWDRMARWSGNWDVEDVPGTVLLRDERDALYNRFVADMPEADWLPPNTVVSVSRWARFSAPMRQAEHIGLGWILPIQGEVLLVPMPRTRYQDGLLHCDTGRPAIEWADGSGPYFLHGVGFEEALLRAVLAGELSVRRIASLRNKDQRAIALRYLTFDRATEAGAERIDNDVYRLALPRRLAADRSIGPGPFLYLRRLGNSQSIQWVDPRTVLDPEPMPRQKLRCL
ncbi:hypothetical protein ACWDUN_02545 [Mycobacterium sp. NPDC003323]